MMSFKILSAREEQDLNYNKRSSSYKNYPKIRKIREEILPGYNRVFDLIEDKKRTMKFFGFDCNCKEFGGRRCTHYYQLRRFPWRFRMAQHDILFYTDNKLLSTQKKTGRGYSSLVKFFMVWNSFEVYTNLFGISPEKFFKNLSSRKIIKICNRIRKTDKRTNDGKYLLTEHLFLYCQSENAEKLNFFIKGDDSHFMFYCRNIRNMFVHGELSAGPNGLSATSFSNLLNDLSIFFIDEIKNHFLNVSKL